MKGQFIAVEAVMSLGIGLMVTLGLLTAFTAFQGSIMDDVEEAQVDAVQTKIAVALMQVGTTNVSNAQVELDLPDSLGDSSYQITMDNGKLFVLSGGDRYVKTFENLNASYSFSGSATGGEVSIFKEQNNLMVSDSG